MKVGAVFEKIVFFSARNKNSARLRISKEESDLAVEP